MFIHFNIMYTFEHKLGLLFAWHFIMDVVDGSNANATAVGGN